MGIRVLRFSLVIILVLLLVAGALTNLLPNIKEDKMLTVRREIKSQSKSALDSFTLIMQTYNRTDLLLRLLNHYQAVPNLHKVIVVWNNVGEKGPEELWNSLGPHPIPVLFKPQTANKMRNRLQVFPEVETNAVLMVDDDVLISAQDLVFAFSIWQVQRLSPLSSRQEHDSIQAGMVQEELRGLHLHLQASKKTDFQAARTGVLKPMPTVTHLSQQGY